jgi:hypothetical protein
MSKPETLEYGQAPKKRCGLAIASLTLSLVAFPTLPLFFAGMPVALAGVILGIVSVVRMRHRPNLLGKSMAIVGMALGGVALLVGTACGMMLQGPMR